MDENIHLKHKYEGENHPTGAAPACHRSRETSIESGADAPGRPPPPGRDSLLLTIDDVARVLQVSNRTIWRRVSTGDLPAPIAVGRSKRWSRQTVSEWVAQKSVSPRSAPGGGRR